MIIKAIIFDLDNTLYDAHQYYTGAFNEIISYLSLKHNISSKSLLQRLIEIRNVRTSMYPYLFNEFLDEFNLIFELNHVINIYNNYCGPLQPYVDVVQTLSIIKKGNKIGLVTDGNSQRQKRKLELLNLKIFFDAIIFTDELKAPKPSKVPFIRVLKLLQVDPEESIYVGDNPKIDFCGSKTLGMRTIRLIKGEFKDIESNEKIDFEIKKFSEILQVLENE